MYANTVARGTRSVTRALAVAVAGLFFSGLLAAKDHEVTVALHVSTAGLDLSQPADARTVYQRLQYAAWEACNRGNRVGLAPVDDPRKCLEGALARAIGTAKVPLLTRLYLEDHTLGEAAARGIREPAQIAAK